MPDANTEILAFQNELDNLVRLYSVKVVRPYTRAYEAARMAFMETLDDQARRNAERAQVIKDLTLAAFSIAGGALLTRVFATAALSTVAKDVSLNVICNNNLEKAFKVAALIDSSPVASYIVGELWDQGQSYISDKVKAAIELNGINFAAMQRFTTTPLAAATYFHDFVDDAATKVFAVTRDLRESNLSDAEKIHALNKLKSSQFCKGPPAQVDETQAARDIELTWWMQFLLDLDYIQTVHIYDPSANTSFAGTPALSGPGTTVRHSYKPISESPSSTANYPKARQETFVKTPRGEYTQIRYRQYRQLDSWYDGIRARIDGIYKARVGKPFFDRATVDRGTLVRAERTLNLIGNENISRLQAQIKAA